MTSRFKPGNLFRELEDINGFENISAGKTYGLRQRVFGGPLEASDTSLSFSVDPSGGLDILAGGVGIKPYSLGGLQTSSDGASIKIDTSGGLSTGVGGLKILHPGDSGIQTDTNGTKIKKDTTKPGNLITLSTNGLSAETKISYIEALLMGPLLLNVANSKLWFDSVSSYGETIATPNNGEDELIIQKSGRYRVDYSILYMGDSISSPDGYPILFRLNNGITIIKQSGFITIKNLLRGEATGFYHGSFLAGERIYLDMGVGGALAPTPNDRVEILVADFRSELVLTYLGP